MKEKVQSWSSSLQALSRFLRLIHVWPIVHINYIHGLANKWTYLLQIVPNISDFLEPLGNVIFHHFVLALVGKPISDLEHALFALPVRLGGLGICDPWTLANSEFVALVKVTQPLVNVSINREHLMLILLLANVRLRLRSLL